MRAVAARCECLFFVLIASYAGDIAVRNYALIGNAFSFAIIASTVNFAQLLEWEKGLGTWPLIVATPSPVWVTLIGLSAAYLVEAFVGSSFAFIILSFGADLHFTQSSVILSILPFLLMLMSAGSLGWLLGALTLPVRFGMLAANMIGYAMLVLCGVNFPLGALPQPLSMIVHLMPITNGLLAVRGLLDGRHFVEMLPLILAEFGIAVTYALLAQRIFSHRLSFARKSGQLEIF